MVGGGWQVVGGLWCSVYPAKKFADASFDVACKHTHAESNKKDLKFGSPNVLPPKKPTHQTPFKRTTMPSECHYEWLPRRALFMFVLNFRKQCTDKNTIIAKLQKHPFNPKI